MSEPRIARMTRTTRPCPIRVIRAIRGSISLEVEAKLSFELPPFIGFGLDAAKWRDAIQAQVRRTHERMVQDVCRIDPEFDTLRFWNPDKFTHRRVERPCSG